MDIEGAGSECVGSNFRAATWLSSPAEGSFAGALVVETAAGPYFARAPSDQPSTISQT
jgi:hypothetical protein